MIRLLRWIVLGLAFWLTFHGVVVPDFQPVEISFDMNDPSVEKALSGDWKVVWRMMAYVDIYLIGNEGVVTFHLPKPQTVWMRLKAKFVQKGQKISLSLNGGRWQTVAVSDEIESAQKFAWIVPFEGLQAGENRLALGVSQGPPVLIEKIEIRNFRSRCDPPLLYIGIPNTFPLSWRGFNSTLHTLWVLGFGVLLAALYDWLSRRSIQSASNARWIPRATLGWIRWIHRVGFYIPFVFFVGCLIASWVTSYRVFIPAVLFLWLIPLSMAFFQCVDWLSRVGIWVWYKRRITQSYIFKTIGWTQWIGRHRGAIFQPQRWYAVMCGFWMASGLVLIVQGIIYWWIAKDVGDVVNLHGGYPFLRRLAEWLWDVGFFALGPMILSLAVKRWRIKADG